MLSIAQSRKGIDTPEGLQMAKNKFQLDEKKADKNADGKLSKYERVTGEAAQKADRDDPEQDEKVRLYHGGIMSDPLPIGSSPENIADDIEVMISQGEYVLPANVVKWHGLKHIMSMQDEAEMGLMMMHDMGLMVEVGDETQEEPDSEGVDDAQVSAASDPEQEETETTIETPEGNEIELAAVETIYEQPEVDETEDYQNNQYGKSSAYGTMRTPKFSFIV